MTTRGPRRIVLVPALMALSLGVAACGSSSKTSTPPASTPSAVVTTAAAPTTPAAAPTSDADSPSADADASSPDADASSPDADATSPDADADSGSPDADASALAGAAAMDCGDLLKPDADAAAAIPKGFPTVKGFTAYAKSSAGATFIVRGYTDGDPDELPTIRDAGIKLLEAAGYKEGDHDQEANAEADGDFTGPHAGNINVKPLCKEHVVVTYTITS